MTVYAYNFASWVNADPRRAKVLSIVALLGLFAAAHLVPGAEAFAGPAGGSGDVGNL